MRKEDWWGREERTGGGERAQKKRRRKKRQLHICKRIGWEKEKEKEKNVMSAFPSLLSNTVTFGTAGVTKL